MNPFPPVIRIFEILFHPFMDYATGGTMRPGRNSPPWDIPGRLELSLRTLAQVFQHDGKRVFNCIAMSIKRNSSSHGNRLIQPHVDGNFLLDLEGWPANRGRFK
jgi:hypothetical protein